MRRTNSAFSPLATLAMHRLSLYNSGGADAAAAGTSAEAASSVASAASGTDATAVVGTAAPGNATAVAAGTADASAAAAATAAATATVPEKYDLKLPDGSAFQADFVTRTADIARALGLTNEAGQKLLDAQIAEVTQARTAAIDAGKAEQLAAMQPGGAIWTEQQTQWRSQCLADAEIGGSPEKLQATVDLAQKVMNRFATEDTNKFLKDSGLGSHPELVRAFARIGRQMSEATLVRSSGNATGVRTEDEKLAARYPTMAAKS